ncbi:hypothetical protein B484DRAFT_415358, partial [Ochromonadaceae sp. CCMP2298]
MEDIEITELAAETEVGVGGAGAEAKIAKVEPRAEAKAAGAAYSVYVSMPHTLSLGALTARRAVRGLQSVCAQTSTETIQKISDILQQAAATALASTGEGGVGGEVVGGAEEKGQGQGTGQAQYVLQDVDLMTAAVLEDSPIEAEAEALQISVGRRLREGRRLVEDWLEAHVHSTHELSLASARELVSSLDLTPIPGSLPAPKVVQGWRGSLEDGPEFGATEGPRPYDSALLEASLLEAPAYMDHEPPPFDADDYAYHVNTPTSAWHSRQIREGGGGSLKDKGTTINMIKGPQMLHSVECIVQRELYIMSLYWDWKMQIGELQAKRYLNSSEYFLSVFEITPLMISQLTNSPPDMGLHLLSQDSRRVVTVVVGALAGESINPIYHGEIERHAHHGKVENRWSLQSMGELLQKKGNRRGGVSMLQKRGNPGPEGAHLRHNSMGVEEGRLGSNTSFMEDHGHLLQVLTMRKKHGELLAYAFPHKRREGEDLPTFASLSLDVSTPHTPKTPGSSRRH